MALLYIFQNQVIFINLILKKNVKLKRLKNLQVTNYSNFIKQAGGVGEPNHQKHFPY